MNNNYHYIIAGLPHLMIENENKGINYDDFRKSIAESCSIDDLKMIEWLEFGFKSQNLNSHFYKAVLKQKNNFIKEYFKLDLLIRNSIVIYRNSTINPKGKAQSKDQLLKYQVLPQLIDINTLPSTISKELSTIFSTQDILKKEQLLDRFKWDRINEFTNYGEFTLDTILSFLAKVQLIDRWNKLDKALGEKLFKQLVEEVKGSYRSENN